MEFKMAHNVNFAVLPLQKNQFSSQSVYNVNTILIS